MKDIQSRGPQRACESGTSVAAYKGMITHKYKIGYIHENLQTNVILVQVDPHAYPIQVKSFHAAKLLITKHMKHYGG